MTTRTIGKIKVVLIDEKSCCDAFEQLAAKHHLTADHPFVRELQALMTIDDVDAFPTYLVNRAEGHL